MVIFFHLMLFFSSSLKGDLSFLSVLLIFRFCSHLLLCGKAITWIHFSVPGWHNRLLIAHFTPAASPLAPRFSLVISTEDMAALPLGHGGSFFWPLTSNHSWWGADEAATSSWFCHIIRKPAWPQSDMAGWCPTERPEEHTAWWSERGNEPERTAIMTAGHQGKDGQAFTSVRVGVLPAEADVVRRFGDLLTQGRLFKWFDGQMWF